MKILHTIHCLNKSWGGPSVCTYQLVKALNLTGIDTDLLSLSSKTKDDCIGTDPFIKYVEYDARTPLGISRNFKQFLVANVNRYDIVHANTIWLCTTHDAIHVAKKRNKPVVLSLHGMLYPQALQVSRWKKQLVLPLFQRKDLRRADVLHATSMAELKSVRDFGLTQPVAVLPNGIEIDTLPTMRQHENKIRHFGFIGRINRIKNIDTLLDAWAALGDKTAGCKLSIIGGDDAVYENELRQFVVDRHLGNVEFAGFLSGERLTQATRELDYLVLPSKSENFGMVVIEALANGIPVIASTGTPWEELNSHRCGWWIDCTTDTLAKTLSEAIDLKESDRMEMGHNGQLLVARNYTIGEIALKFRQLYEWIAGNGPKPDFIF